MMNASQPLSDDDTQDISLHSYQDDLDTHGTDRIMDEFGDDPTKDLGVDPAKFKQELSRLDIDDASDDAEGEPDDMREEVEGMDLDPDRSNDY